MTAKTEVFTNDGIQDGLNKKAKQKKRIAQILPYAGLVLLIILFMFTTNNRFLEPVNLTNLVDQGYTLIIIAVGAAFIFSAGLLDLSIGSVMAVAQLLTALVLRGRYAPVPVAILVSLGTGALLCSITALIHLLLKVPIIIASLCMMSICTGIVTISVEKSDIYIPYSELGYFNTTPVMLTVLIIVLATGVFIFHYTRLGRDLKALGGNAAAAEQSGVNQFRSKLLSFVVMGLCIGIAAFFSLIRGGVVNGASGSGIQMNIIIAIVLGGFPLMGGSKAKIVSAIIGALTITVLSNGLILMGLDPAWAVLVKGFLFMTIIAVTYEKVPVRDVH